MHGESCCNAADGTVRADCNEFLGGSGAFCELLHAKMFAKEALPGVRIWQPGNSFNSLALASA
jgi:hypothetical protein